MKKIHLGGTGRNPDDVKALHKLGLEFAEIPVSNPEKFSSEIHDYQRVREQTGLYYLCHGPREGDPNDKEALEDVYFPKLIQVLEIMPQLAMTLLTVHLWIDSRFVKKDVLGYKNGLLQRLTARAEASGITVCLENLSEQAHDLREVLEAVPLLGITLDLGHSQLLSGKNTSLDIMDMLAERIRHIHIHDNRGGNSPADDLHLPVGEGEIDFESIFGRIKRIGYKGTMTLELRPDEIKDCISYVERLAEQAGVR